MQARFQAHACTAARAPMQLPCTPLSPSMLAPHSTPVPQPQPQSHQTPPQPGRHLQAPAPEPDWHSFIRDEAVNGPSGKPLPPNMDACAHIFLNESGLSLTRPPLTPGESGEHEYRVIPFQILSWWPRVVLLPAFLDSARCDAIVSLTANKMRKSDIAFKPGETVDPDQVRLVCSQLCIVRMHARWVYTSGMPAHSSHTPSHALIDHGVHHSALPHRLFRLVPSPRRAGNTRCC